MNTLGLILLVLNVAMGFINLRNGYRGYAAFNAVGAGVVSWGLSL